MMVLKSECMIFFILLKDNLNTFFVNDCVEDFVAKLS